MPTVGGPFKYLLFAVAFYGVFTLAVRARISPARTLLFGSLAFYGLWNFSYLPVLLISITLAFWFGLAIQRSSLGARKIYLWTSVSVSVGVLVFFKFPIGFSTSKPAEILPIGISFYLFQCISYVVDVYRGTLPACTVWAEFATCISYFPNLLAGPLIRVPQLLPQIRNLELPGRADMEHAMFMIALGCFKKALADSLGLLADLGFDHSSNQSTLDAWAGALAFYGQLYADFSGYTDMAIGVSASLGIALPENFRMPFLANSPEDFWSRRWHLTLSRWVRDYVFLPLALSMRRGMRGSAYFAITVSMLVMALWHGVTWAFLVFGVYHSLLLISGHFLFGALPKLEQGWLGKCLRVPRVVLTFYLMVLGYVLFRAPSLKTAGEFIQRMHHFSAGAGVTDNVGFFRVIALLLATYGVSYWACAPRFAGRLSRSPLGACAALVFATYLLYVSGLSGGGGRPFIYFEY